jgi:8-oxo-dGTP pyrophosphatase MutT (NUDIX family)
MHFDHLALNKEKIKELLSLNDVESKSCGERSIYRRAAVLVPLLIEKGEWHALFTRRTDMVEDHKNQVSFPGGSTEPGDESILQTALREAHEEIGLDERQVEILGNLQELCTNSNFRVTPVVGQIVWPTILTLSTIEVKKVFIVPLRWLAEASHSYLWPFVDDSGKQHDVIFFVPYDDEVIWGITAQIVYALLDRLELK